MFNATPNFRTFLGVFAIAATACVVFYLAGCATLMSAQARPFEEIGVAVAVDTVVGSNKATQAARAHAVADVAAKVLAADLGVVTTVDSLKAVAAARVAALDLPPGDAAAAAILLSVVGHAVDQYVASLSGGASAGNAQVAVSTVCKWVIAEAQRLGG